MGRHADVKIYHHLRSQIPRSHLTSIIIRIACFSLILMLSVFYALSQPEVFYDQVIWNPEDTTNPSYNITIFRNITQDRNPSERASIGLMMSNTTTVTWNKTGPPTGLGLTTPLPCSGLLKEEHICEEGQVVASRIAWLDSWPPLEMPDWLKQTIYLDRYIFWTVIIGGALGLGHITTVLVHSLEPVGIGFLKYCGAVDFFLSLVFLLLGIYPLSVMDHYKLVLPSDGYMMRKGMDDFVYVLEPAQKYAFVMGWTGWVLFTVSGLMDFFIISSLCQYREVRSKVVTVGDEVVSNDSGEAPMPFQPLTDAVGSTTGYDAGRAFSHASTVSRAAGRNMAPVAESESVGSRFAVEV